MCGGGSKRWGFKWGDRDEIGRDRQGQGKIDRDREKNEDRKSKIEG
jgi:hypothetical protein